MRRGWELQSGGLKNVHACTVYTQPNPHEWASKTLQLKASHMAKPATSPVRPAVIERYRYMYSMWTMPHPVGGAC